MISQITTTPRLVGINRLGTGWYPKPNLGVQAALPSRKPINLGEGEAPHLHSRRGEAGWTPQNLVLRRTSQWVGLPSRSRNNHLRTGQPRCPPRRADVSRKSVSLLTRTFMEKLKYRFYFGRFWAEVGPGTVTNGSGLNNAA